MNGVAIEIFRPDPQIYQLNIRREDDRLIMSLSFEKIILVSSLPELALEVSSKDLLPARLGTTYRGGLHAQ